MSMIQNFMNEGAHGIIEEFENIKHCSARFKWIYRGRKRRKDSYLLTEGGTENKRVFKITINEGVQLFRH